jgi:hypothetical protein
MNLSWFSTNSFASASDLLNTNTTLSTDYTGNLIDYQDMWVSNNGYEDSTGNLIDFGFYVSGLDINAYNELLKLGSVADASDVYCGLYVIFGYTTSTGSQSWIDKFETSIANEEYTFLNIPSSVMYSAPASGATFNFTLPLGSTGSYTVPMVDIASGGTGYAVGDSCYVSGSALGGVDSINDAYVTASTVTGASRTYTNIFIPGGLGGYCSVTVSAGGVYSVSLTSGGAGYTASSQTISGEVLGGTSPANNLTVSIGVTGGGVINSISTTSTNGKIRGAIASVTVTGTHENPSYIFNSNYAKFRVNWDAGTNILNKINISSAYTYNGSTYVLRNTFPVNEGSSNANDETKGRLKVRFIIKSPPAGSSILSKITLNAAALGEL